MYVVKHGLGVGPYHAVICAGLAAERHWFFGYAFVHHAVREHGLAGDSEDEGAERDVVSGFGLRPHASVAVNFRRLGGQMQASEGRGINSPSMTLLTFDIARMTLFMPASKASRSWASHASRAETTPSTSGPEFCTMST